MKHGWELKRLGEVCEKTSNIRWQEHEGVEFEYIDLTAVSRDTLEITETVSINSLNAPSRARKIIKTNDIIFATTRPTLKRVAKISNKYDNQICSTGFAVLRGKQNVITPEYVFYFLQTDQFMNRMESVQRGTSYPAVTVKDVKETPLPRPLTIDEQKRIVAKLDECFEAIDKARANVERNLQNAKELFQSKLNEIFSQKGDGWVEKVLDEIGEIQTGTTPPTKDKSNYGDFIPFVKPPHFKPDGSIDTGNSMLSESGLKKGRLFPPNSVLMVCIGATIGKTGFTETAVSSNQQINCLTPTENYNPKLFYYGLISPFVQKQVSDIGKGAQATLPIINKTKWQGLKINIPGNKAEQNKIVNQLDDLKSQTQSLESHYQQELYALDELKKSILQKAFNGEL